MGTAHKGKVTTVEKRPRARFLLSFIKPGVDQFTVKLAVTTHTHTHATQGLRSTVSLHLEHLHHLRALGVMATVSTGTTEKLDDDETAGRVDKQFRAEQ